MAEAYPAKHPALGELTTLTRADGVVATSGPYPMASPVLRTGKIADPVFAERRDETMPAIDRPYLTAGTWVRPGGVVIERGFAGQLNVHVGSRVTLDDRPFQVAGIAVDTGRGANWRPHLVWVTRDDALRLASPGDQLAYVLNLRLADPATAPAFAAAHSSPSLFIAYLDNFGRYVSHLGDFSQVDPCHHSRIPGVSQGLAEKAMPDRIRARERRDSMSDPHRRACRRAFRVR